MERGDGNIELTLFFWKDSGKGGRGVGSRFSSAKRLWALHFLRLLLRGACGPAVVPLPLLVPWRVGRDAGTSWGDQRGGG